VNEEIFDRYMQAGAVAKKILTAGAERIKPGVLLLEIATFVEDCIMRKDLE